MRQYPRPHQSGEHARTSSSVVGPPRHRRSRRHLDAPLRPHDLAFVLSAHSRRIPARRTFATQREAGATHHRCRAGHIPMDEEFCPIVRARRVRKDVLSQRRRATGWSWNRPDLLQQRRQLATRTLRGRPTESLDTRVDRHVVAVDASASSTPRPKPNALNQGRRGASGVRDSASSSAKRAAAKGTRLPVMSRPRAKSSRTPTPCRTPNSFSDHRRTT